MLCLKIGLDVQTIADLEEIAFEFKDKKKKRLRVSTKYPNLTREFFYNKVLLNLNWLKVWKHRSCSIYRFSRIITDITSTGETLKANNLRIINDGEILKSEACMMVSKK